MNAKDDTSALLELYKLYVQTAENTSNRRLRSNSFYLTFCSVLATSAYAIFRLETIDNIFIVIAGIFGVFFSVVWFFNIRSYKQLNSGKFKVILRMEEQLPFKCFTEEWEELGQTGNGRKKLYRLITGIESHIPIIFFLLFTAIIIIHMLLI